MLSNKLDEKTLIHHLGMPTQTFKACWVVTALCLFLGTLFTGMGIAFMCSQKPDRLADVSWGNLCGGALALTIIMGPGIGLLVWAIPRLFFRVSVCPAGIIQVSLRGVAGAFWDQIKTVEHDTAKSPNLEDWQTCRVHREDGFQFVFGSYYPKDVSKLAALIASHVR